MRGVLWDVRTERGQAEVIWAGMSPVPVPFRRSGGDIEVTGAGLWLKHSEALWSSKHVSYRKCQHSFTRSVFVTDHLYRKLLNQVQAGGGNTQNVRNLRNL